MRLHPFFCFYGGKWRLTPKYPAPTHDTIIEPFAGSAGYSVSHHERNVILCDADPVIAGVWRYLIGVRTDEVMRLPLVFDDVRDLGIPQEARWLIGFWLNKGVTAPVNVPSQWMRTAIAENNEKRGIWGELTRARIARQVEHIRHWRVIEGGYGSCPDVPATWFIDPPYQGRAGSYYRVRFSDYPALANWCNTRRGQVMVCEMEGADWLPFVPLADASNQHKRPYKEVVYSCINLVKLEIEANNEGTH